MYQRNNILLKQIYKIEEAIESDQLETNYEYECTKLNNTLETSALHFMQNLTVKYINCA